MSLGYIYIYEFYMYLTTNKLLNKGSHYNIESIRIKIDESGSRHQLEIVMFMIQI